MELRVLAVGDVVGDSGVRLLTRRLHAIKREQNIDFCIVNGENASGIGLTAGTYYVKVRVFKNVDGTAFYSSWSKKKKVKVK